MTDDIDMGDVEQRFARLVAAAAPPTCDPRFRITLMERQEKERFRRQSRVSLALIASVAAFGGAILILQPTSLLNPVTFALGLAVSSVASACAYPLVRRVI